MPAPDALEFFIDPGRCIGCQACIQACTECDTHKGQSMIQLDYVDRAHSTQTAPVVCMHCDSPTCAEVCPADAIKRTEDGIVQTAQQAAVHRLQQLCPRVPVRRAEDADQMNLMMKCDMCYDRTSVGLKPWCASVCPSQALAFGTREEMARLRPTREAGQHVPVRHADHPHQGEHHGAARRRRRKPWT